MKRPDASDFPELRKVFSGYLHEDFLDEHPTAAAAMTAFEADADAEEHARFRAEVTRFLEAVERLDDEDLHALLARLGSRWTPPTREALVAALTGGAKRRRSGDSKRPQRKE